MTAPAVYLGGKVSVFAGDCRDVLAELGDGSIDSVVTDPPYALVSISKRFGPGQKATLGPGQYKRLGRGFMGKTWDTGATAFDPAFWFEVWRVLKPGGHVAAFGGCRTYHRLACAIEDAGFDIRDQVAWVFGSGFPKSHDVAVAIDKAAGAAPARGKAFNFKGRGGRADEFDGNGRQFLPPYEPATDAAAAWAGWGTALKPAWEPICLARKPLVGTVAENVLEHGTGALNVDGCRVATADELGNGVTASTATVGYEGGFRTVRTEGDGLGRWPANLMHDGSAEVVAAFPETASGFKSGGDYARETGVHAGGQRLDGSACYADSGSAARFFASFPGEDEQWNGHASSAASSINLQSEAAASALANALERSTLDVVLSLESYRAHSTSVTASDLSAICASVIGMIRNFAVEPWLARLQGELILSVGPVRVAATRDPTGIMTTILSRPQSNGFVEVVTFDCIAINGVPGAPDCARRLFYSAKADADDRIGSRHPTVKPVDLMAWLCRLITPPGGVVLDPFAGTGTVGEAAWREGFRAVLVELDPDSVADIHRRLEHALSGPDERARAIVKARGEVESPDGLPLFGGVPL
jgi:site-specific DNA-methyltransferase (adenine-specific)